MKHLTLYQGVLFTFNPLIFESENGDLFPIPRYIELTNVVAYNIEKMQGDIEQAQENLQIANPKLEKSLQYLEQSILLNKERSRIAPFLSRNHSQLVSSIFMNLWKALSIIVGDPSVDPDYQSRYKTLDFDYEYFQGKIEWIRNLRNDYDVAHYSLSEQEIEEINGNFGKAQKIVVEVLQRYRDKLLRDDES